MPPADPAVTLLPVCPPEEHQPPVQAAEGGGDALLCGGPPVFRPEGSQLVGPDHPVLWYVHSTPGTNVLKVFTHQQGNHLAKSGSFTATVTNQSIDGQ